MIKYSMSQVATLTGLSAHSLRVWERRYSIIHPQRTETNIRFYTDAEVKKLLNIAILLRNGYRISAIDKMEQEEIYYKVSSLLASDTIAIQDQINALKLSMLNMHEDEFDIIFARSVTKIGFTSTITALIYPFLNMIGGLWTTNKAIPAQEHFISNMIRQKLISAIDLLDKPKKDAYKILLFLLAGESHEIGLLLANYMAKKQGWQVIYLGQNVPTEDIDTTLKIIDADVIMSMFINPRPNKIYSLISQLIKDKDIPFLYSGNPVNFKDNIDAPNATYVKSPIELEAYLQEFTIQLKSLEKFH